MHTPHRLIQLDDLEPPILSAPPFAHASKRHHHVHVGIGQTFMEGCHCCPSYWIIYRQRKDFKPDQVKCGTPVWVLARILGLFDHCLPSSELVLKMIWIVFWIGDVEEIVK